MNLSNLPANLDPADEIPEDEATLFSGSAGVGWQMKKLTPRHRNIAALMAQGASRLETSKICGVTPQYVTMLAQQPLIKAEIARICEAAGTRLEALTEKVVDTIAETLSSGTEGGKLKAARLQLEATKRIGRPDTSPKGEGGAGDRLERLAERLIYLQSGGKRPPGVYDEAGQEITDAEFSELAGGQES